MNNFFITTAKISLNCFPILLAVAFLTLMERKILGLTSQRLSPQKISLMGILQPMGDAVKLANKQENSISFSSISVFSMISALFLTSSLILWTSSMTTPMSMNIMNNVMFVILIMSVNTNMVVFIGWCSYSKFSLLGAIRCAAQTISYEAVMMILVISVCWILKSFSSVQISNYNIPSMLIIPTILLIWLPTCLAEMNRTPYDFSEGESELVSGFNTEFGSKEFSLMFIAEYSNIIFMMVFTSFIFSNSMLMVLFMLIWVLWIRSVLPRFRFDKLMMMAWKSLIPVSTLIISLVVVMI